MKNIEFSIALTVADDYELSESDINQLGELFTTLYPDGNPTYYYDDGVRLSRYFVSGQYHTKIVYKSGLVRHLHTFAKIVELADGFSLDMLVDSLGIHNLTTNNITTLSKL